jgi:hypothetical protein
MIRKDRELEKEIEKKIARLNLAKRNLEYMYFLLTRTAMPFSDKQKIKRRIKELTTP